MSCAERTSPSSAVLSRNQIGESPIHNIQSDQIATINGLGLNLALRRTAAISHKHATRSRQTNTIGQFHTKPVIAIGNSMQAERLNRALPQGVYGGVAVENHGDSTLGEV